MLKVQDNILDTVRIIVSAPNITQLNDLLCLAIIEQNEKRDVLINNQQVIDTLWSQSDTKWPNVAQHHTSILKMQMMRKQDALIEEGVQLEHDGTLISFQTS